MRDTTKKAYVEVIELLKYFPYEEVKKIPNEKIKIFLTFRDKNYKYKVDVEKNFDDQEMMPETRAIFAILYEDYWATEEERKILQDKENQARIEMEADRRKKYNPDDIFKNKKYKKVEEHLNNVSLTINKPSIFDKIRKFLKRLFKK